MATITIHVTDDEKTWLTHMSKHYGMSLSAMILKYSMEQLEDEYDCHIADIAYKEWIDGGQKTVSMHEIMNEFEI